MNTDGWRGRDVADVMGVFGSEGARLARRDSKGRLTGSILFQNTGGYNEGTR